MRRSIVYLGLPEAGQAAVNLCNAKRCLTGNAVHPVNNIGGAERRQLPILMLASLIIWLNFAISPF